MCRCGLVTEAHPTLFGTPWSAVHQAPLSMEFPRQEYRSGLPSPLLGDRSDLGIKPAFPALQVGSLPLSQKGNPWIAFGYADMSKHITKTPGSGEWFFI